MSQRFAQSPRGGEIRNILGWRNDDWLVAVNPIFGLSFSSGVGHTPGLELATKLNRRIAPGWSLGWERYHDRGPYNRFLPGSEQTLVNYLVLENLLEVSMVLEMQIYLQLQLVKVLDLAPDLVELQLVSEVDYVVPLGESE